MLVDQIFINTTRVKEKTLNEHIEDWLQDGETKSKQYWTFVFRKHQLLLKESIPGKSIKVYRQNPIPENGVFENFSNWSKNPLNGYWTLLMPDDIEAVFNENSVVAKPGKYIVEKT